MKALLLAGGMCFVYVLAMTIAFRYARRNIRNAAFLTRLFFLTVPIAIVLYFFTPGDLGFLPDPLLENKAIEISFMLFVYGSCFFGGILQVYGLADRGFSLRISIDIEKSARGSLTVEEVIESYSMGRGTRWLYEKRTEGLETLNLIEVRGSIVRITPAGQRIAVPLAWLRRFLKAENDETRSSI
ncbi:MAG TPA: hypothetical protein VG273_20735 [Bryobacteraceae bacterium]|jgi:hypothetical protein|nr:hypothetical protein [Bryobacteraceae bacterium]